ncbi:MAG: hypothetical protein WCG27_04960 [Pseudomonadota bacterium]
MGIKTIILGACVASVACGSAFADMQSMKIYEKVKQAIGFEVVPGDVVTYSLDTFQVDVSALEIKTRSPKQNESESVQLAVKITKPSGKSYVYSVSDSADVPLTKAIGTQLAWDKQVGKTEAVIVHMNASALYDFLAKANENDQVSIEGRVILNYQLGTQPDASGHIVWFDKGRDVTDFNVQKKAVDAKPEIKFTAVPPTATLISRLEQLKNDKWADLYSYARRDYDIKVAEVRAEIAEKRAMKAEETLAESVAKIDTKVEEKTKELAGKITEEVTARIKADKEQTENLAKTEKAMTDLHNALADAFKAGFKNMDERTGKLEGQMAQIQKAIATIPNTYATRNQVARINIQLGNLDNFRRASDAAHEGWFSSAPKYEVKPLPAEEQAPLLLPYTNNPDSDSPGKMEVR